MSDNPEAFDVLRKVAYSHVNVRGKDAQELKGICEDFLTQWKQRRNGSSILSLDDHKLIDAIVRWVMKRYNRPRPKPKRTREERALDIVLTPTAYEMDREDTGRSSIRNTARSMEKSKSTVQRHLAHMGVAPRRDKKIGRLSKTAQTLVRILDQTFSRKYAGIIKLDDMTSAVWDGKEIRREPPTTAASRRSKFKQLVGEVSKANLGYSLTIWDGLVGVQRGRHWASQSECVTWIEEQKRLGKFVQIQFPEPKAEHQLFWADPYVIDVMKLIEMGVTGYFYPFENMNAVLRFEHILVDMTPIIPWFERAHHSFAGPNLEENLSNLAHHITDATVRSATYKLSTILSKLKNWMGHEPFCSDAFLTVDMVLQVMDKAAFRAPESYARLAYLKDMFDKSGDYYWDVREQLFTMVDREKAGEWIAPDADTLAQYMPAASDETL